MLQFFKKSGRSAEHHEEKTPDDVKEFMQSSSHLDIILDNDENINNGKEFIETRSRLSKNLTEIISDKNCICYFVQFLETKNALSLIKFYLDAENFKTVTELSLKSQQYNHEINTESIALKLTKNNDCSFNNDELYERFDGDTCNSLASSVCQEPHCDNTLVNSTITTTTVISQSKYSLKDLKSKTKSLEETLKNDTIQEDDNDDNDDNDENSSVPELKSLCDLSMRKPLTDDEKSRIYAKTNKINMKHKNDRNSLKTQNNERNLISSKSNNCIDMDYNSSCSSKFNSAITTDAIRIYKKYLTLNSQYFIDNIPTTIISNISLSLCAKHNNDDDNNGIDDNDKDTNTIKSNAISPNCFEEAKCYVFERMEKEYLNDFLESNFYCKYCLDILLSSKLRLSDIIHNESALFYFMEYLEQENHRNYLEFWMAAINFRKHYYNRYRIENDFNIKNEAQNDAMILYEKYFSLQANDACRLKISDRVRCKIEENICSDNTEEICKCFDIPLKLIENHLEMNYLKKFIKSQLFTNYCNELRNKLDDYKTLPRHKSLSSSTSASSSSSVSMNNGDDGNDNGSNKNKKRATHRKTMSDCTNENTKNIRNGSFISQHNTLLAMESSLKTKPNLYNRNSANAGTQPTTADMQIETRYLTNPDLLWYRNTSSSSSLGGSNIGNNGIGNGSGGGLTFGRIDALGRYERDFEMETTTEDKWSLATGSNKIKNAVRKLVNLPEEKVQEEIAWQVAELIVKDITSITLGGTGNNFMINNNNNNNSKIITNNNNERKNNCIENDG